MKPNETAAAHDGPYAELLRDVPAVMREPLKEAYDAAAALAWLMHATTPDAGAPGGVDPGREHLDEIGAEGKGRRRVRWDGNVYSNDEDDLDEFLRKTELNEGPRGFSTKLKDRLRWRQALAIVVGRPGQPDGNESETVVPAGAFYAVVEYTALNETLSYQGVYELKRRCATSEQPESGPLERRWLNATAERLLAEALTRCAESGTDGSAPQGACATRSQTYRSSRPGSRTPGTGRRPRPRNPGRATTSSRRRPRAPAGCGIRSGSIRRCRSASARTRSCWAASAC